ncbi:MULTISPECIES: GNAT family N-acetyltransferase [Bacillaceae]|uniref:GCN5 family acetyltransferase n=1 Tax=Oceanobacillus caeni TaxID=405946 RepID=A0ABR5MKF5_9BACI|nr:MULTISPECIES: GNAT family N-acetyltransferase [Bacillaceae]KPH76254.1 GCN5 family acetyltransferase [Oceanobacillus caeni]MED4473178.1 GNAT family N-acetyltransferase [Oceanobacillus caeni]
MEIALFEEKHLPECTSTFMDVFNQEPWNDEWTKETAKNYLEDFTHTPGFKGIVAFDGEEMIGFIFGNLKHWWSGDEFFINEMCVVADKQNSGIGSKMMNNLIKELKLDGVSMISLLTDRGIPAEGFYKKHGFSEIERLVFLSRSM